MKNKYFLLILLFSFFPFVFAGSSYIHGNVTDALDGTSANNKVVVLWNPAVGIQDNLTDIIGPNGNSGQDNAYLLDCFLLSSSCKNGDTINMRVLDDGLGYESKNVVSVSISNQKDYYPNDLYLNSPVSFNSVLVEDSINVTANEIDLLANNTREVFCESVLEEFDGESITNIYSEFFSSDSSSFGDIDDNNYHYSNSSCFINSSYGNENQTKVSCKFNVWYYANSENWKCTINAADNFSNYTGEDSTFVNPLLSIETLDSLNFGNSVGGNVSNETEFVVYNRGNVLLDLSLSGYGSTQGDGYSMICGAGSNIDIFHKKYSFVSHPGSMDFSEFDANYFNLSSAPITSDFNLDFRKDDSFDLAFNSTFWRVYIPVGTTGSCQGNIVFGAVMSV